MPILWLILGAVSLCIGIAGYIYQKVIRNSTWNWSQIESIETVVVITMSLGIMLLFVALIDYIERKKR